jgi:hypothetical protein
MVDLAYDWSLMGWGMRAIVIALAAALILVVLSPHVAVLKPVAERLGLVSTVTQTIYVPVNHTVYVNRTIYVNYTRYIYVNKTVPIYINRTVYVPVSSYFESYAGYCSGRLVILPNNTAWIVWFWLAPKAYFQTPFLGPYLRNFYFANYTLVYYNSTTHYAQFAPGLLDVGFLSPQGLTLEMNAPLCYIDNVTIGNYYILACGDTPGDGPISFSGDTFIRNSTGMWEVISSLELPVVGNFTALGAFSYYVPIPLRNATYTGVLIIPYYINGQTTYTLGPICDLTVTFVSNATAALWLPVTTNQTLVGYWGYADEFVYGHYNPYDYTMGYWVWNYPW